MRIRKNDRRIREVAGQAAGIAAERVFVEQQEDWVIVNLPTTMLLSPEERQRVAREVERAVPAGLRVSLV